MELDIINSLVLIGDAKGTIIYSDDHNFQIKNTIKIHGNKEPITDIR